MRTWGKIVLTFCRNYRAPKRWKEDGVKAELLTYYPRHKDFTEPEIKPSKLLMVQRVKPYKGNPYWQKSILDTLGIGEDAKMSKYAIVKNTPEVCATLWTVKHLVKISPVELPQNQIDEAIVDRVWLQESGELTKIPKVDSVRYEASLKYYNSNKRLLPEEIQTILRQKWINGDVP